MGRQETFLKNEKQNKLELIQDMIRDVGEKIRQVANWERN